MKLAPFKKMPLTEELNMKKYEERLDSGQCEIEMIDDTNKSIESSVSGEEVMLDSSLCKNFTCLPQSPRKIDYDSSEVSSHFNTFDFDYAWSVGADAQHENVQMKYGISPCSSALVIEKGKGICSVAEGTLKHF